MLTDACFPVFSLKGLNKVKETEVLLVLSQVSRTVISAQLQVLSMTTFFITVQSIILGPIISYILAKNVVIPGVSPLYSMMGTTLHF
jgi:hypothetical protein